MAVNATFIRRRGLKVCSVGHTRARTQTDTHGFVSLKIARLVTFVVISIWAPKNMRQWASNSLEDALFHLRTLIG